MPSVILTNNFPNYFNLNLISDSFKIKMSRVHTLLTKLKNKYTFFKVSSLGYWVGP